MIGREQFWWLVYGSCGGDLIHGLCKHDASYVVASTISSAIFIGVAKLIFPVADRCLGTVGAEE